MSPQDRAKFNRVTAELAELRQATRLIPVRWSNASVQFYLLVMGNGNTIATFGGTPYYGVKYSGTVPTTVPTTSPSLVAGSLPDNLSSATLYGADGSITTVWTASQANPDGAGSTLNDLPSIVSYLTTYVSFRRIRMQVAATGVYVPVYLTGRVA